MSCHESLLARKKRQISQRAKIPAPLANTTLSPGSSELSRRPTSSFKDKSLPSLPPKDNVDESAFLPPLHSPIPPAQPSFASPPSRPSRPSKPPFDPSLSRGVFRHSGSSFNTEKQESSRSENGYAPIVSVSQSTPGYSLNNGYTSPSATFTETRSISNGLPSQSMSRSISSVDWDNRSSRLSTDSSRSSDYYDSFSHAPTSSRVPRKPIAKLDGSSEENNFRMSQVSSRGGIYLDSSFTDSLEVRPDTDSNQYKSDEASIPERSTLRAPSPRVPSHYSDDDYRSPPHTPIREKRSTKQSNTLQSTYMPRVSIGSDTYFVDSKLEKENDSADEEHLSTPSFSLDSYLFDDAESSTTRELMEAQKTIAELKQRLRERENRDTHKPDVHVLESNIREKRKTIAGLEAKGELAKKELFMLEEARSRKGSLKESSSDLVADFTREVSRVKTSLQKDIEDLVIKRDHLLDEIYTLGLSRDGIIEETSMLKMRHQQLQTLHGELNKQISDRYGIFNKYGKEELVEPHQAIEDVPLVTILDGGDDKKDRQSAKRFWKRPIVKGVKGFNKVFTADNTISHGPYVDGEVNNVHQVTTISNGGKANFATIREIPAKQKSKNGWFKNNTETSTTTATAPTKPESQLMGYPIEKRIELEDTKIPLIVTRCIQEVEERAIDSEGIYRKSGAKSQIQTIEDAFEKTFDQEADFDEILSGDIAGVTSALKQYLRYLPNSLIHIDYYDSFVEAAKYEKQVAIEKLRAVVNALPLPYQDCLLCVVSHLSRVSQHSEQNLMTSRNLAVCFAPTLVRHTEGEREILDMGPRNDGTQLMIEHYEEVFCDLIKM